MEIKISGPEGIQQRVSLIRDSMSLGRAPENALSYPDDPWLSRRHLCFEYRADHWYVRDCASRNGTVVNANPLRTPHCLEAGDRIYAGHLTIEVDEQSSRTEVVSFVPQAASEHPAEATIVTSLDRVLKQTAQAAREPGDAAANQSRVVQALIRAGQELAGHRSLEELFPLILDLALSAIDAQRGVILTGDGEELEVRASRGHEFAISTAVRDRVLREKCSLVISDAQADDSFRKQQSIVMHRVRSMIAAPLQTGDRVIGLIYVDNGAILRPFVQEDLDLLTVMANVAAIRIEHARLAEVEEQERKMTLELSQASEIQRSLLPRAVPVVAGWDLAGFNLPCRTVGGDYYDFTIRKDGQLSLVVGDVSGKGLPAALMMSSLQARVQMLVETQPEPAAALSILNRSLSERFPTGKFITFFYALLSPENGRLRYCNAGHNYPILLRADGTVVELSGSDMVLGVVPHVPYTTREITLKPGDTLALYSDGVTEARNLQSEEFGEFGLSQFLEQSTGQSCLETIDSLVRHVRTWCGSASFTDDFTVVLLKRTPVNRPDDLPDLLPSATLTGKQVRSI